MARSIRWPPEIQNGRLVWTFDSAEAVKQIVRLSLTIGRTAHPFLDDGPLEAFDAQTAADEHRIADRVRDVFRRLESDRRARLASVNVIRDRVTGETQVLVEYDDLENGRRERLEASVDGR